MYIRVDKIYKLSDDYQEIFISNRANDVAQYDELPLSSRTIHKDFYDNIYILESHKLYKIKYNLDGYRKHNDDSQQIRFFFYDRLLDVGLIVKKINVAERIVYFYNVNENNIMIEDKAKIGEWYRMQRMVNY